MTRKEAIKIIEVVFKSKEAYKHNDSVTHQALNMAIEALSAETVQVVRCKDCKNWNEWGNGVGSCHRSENRYYWFGTNMNDYCSFGERREEEE